MGPSLCNGDFTSGMAVKKMLNGEYPGLPKVMLPLVDVREVAFAHLQAIKVPEARNNRFALVSESFWFKQMAESLKEEFGASYSFTTKELGYCPAKLASFFSIELKPILPLWGVVVTLNNKKSKDILGIKYIHPSESLNAMGYSLIENGLLKDKRKTKK